MIHLLIFAYLSVLAGDHGHALLETFGLILSAIFFVLWLVGTVIEAAAAREDS